MYYKVVKNTELFTKLNALREEMRRCNKEALDLVKRMGYKSFRLGWDCCAGGVSAVKIESGRPHGWKCAYKNKERDISFMPAKIKANEIILQLIKELPVVSWDKFNSTFGYDWTLHCEGPAMMSFPGYYMHEEYWLLHFNESANLYKPIFDMTEITFSEYTDLLPQKEEIEQKKICNEMGETI